MPMPASCSARALRTTLVGLASPVLISSHRWLTQGFGDAADLDIVDARKKKLLILLFVLLLSLLVALCRCCSFVINSMLALFYCVFVSGTRRPLAKRVEKKVQRAKRALRGAKEAFTTIVPGLARLCLAMSIGVLPLRSHMLLSQTTTHSYNTRCLACRPPAQCKTCVFGFHTTTLSEYTS